MNNLNKDIEDQKLIIFGWITTVLGIPEMGDPTKYNELTDRLFALQQKAVIAAMGKLHDNLITDIGWEGSSVPLDVINRVFKAHIKELGAENVKKYKCGCTIGQYISIESLEARE